MSPYNIILHALALVGALVLSPVALWATVWLPLRWLGLRVTSSRWKFEPRDDWGPWSEFDAYNGGFPIRGVYLAPHFPRWVVGLGHDRDTKRDQWGLWRSQNGRLLGLRWGGWFVGAERRAA